MNSCRGSDLDPGRPRLVADSRSVRGRRAATIIEVVMALAILGVALPPLVTAFADAARQSVHPAQAAVASFLVIDRMEEIVARRYRGKQDGVSGYDALTSANFPDETPVPGFSGFSRFVTVAEVDAALQPSATAVGYRKVRVTVTWNGGQDQMAVERVFADF